MTDNTYLILKRIWLQAEPTRSFWQNDATGDRVAINDRDMLGEHRALGYDITAQSTYFGPYNPDSEAQAEITVYTLTRSKVI